MIRWLAAALFLLISTSALSAQQVGPTPPAAEEVVKISTNLIQLDVSVTDKSGKSIGDLTPDEIEVYENGEKQKISNFSFISGGPRQAGQAGKPVTAGQETFPNRHPDRFSPDRSGEP